MVTDWEWITEIIKDQVKFKQDIEIERAHRSGKIMIDGAPNKRRTIIAKFLNFKILWRNAKVSSKELRSYG